MNVDGRAVRICLPISLWVALLGGIGLIGGPTVAAAATVTVPAGGDLQQALTNAQPGDTILLVPGAVYVGNFTLPFKQGDALITIRTALTVGTNRTSSIVAPRINGERISPDDASRLAAIKSPNSSPALQTAPGAHHWRLMLLEFLANRNGAGDIIALGDGSSAQQSSAQIPHDLIVDRVYVHGDSRSGQKRGIALNSGSTTITGCFIADIKAVGQDSQAIAGWNGPGPYTLTNNYLEAAGENLMFGGADPSVTNLVPADILIANNRFAKPPAWRLEKWTVKNLIELKNARRVTIVGNTFEYNWQAAQSGFAVVFTGRNQDGGCPWCQVDHVTFEHNIVRHSAAGIQILGFDDNHPSQQTQAIVVRHNLFADIDKQRWGGNGYFLSLTGGARDITIEHNTIVQDHASGLVQVDGGPVIGFVLSNNLARHNAYGIIGTDHGIGNDTIGAYLPASLVTRNVLAGGSAGDYPTDNLFPSTAQFEQQFVSYWTGDYRLVDTSPWRHAATDGADLGASFSGVIGSISAIGSQP